MSAYSFDYMTSWSREFPMIILSFLFQNFTVRALTWACLSLVSAPPPFLVDPQPAIILENIEISSDFFDEFLFLNQFFGSLKKQKPQSRFISKLFV